MDEIHAHISIEYKELKYSTSVVWSIVMYMASIEPSFVDELNKVVANCDNDALPRLGPFAFCIC